MDIYEALADGREVALTEGLDPDYGRRVFPRRRVTATFETPDAAAGEPGRKARQKRRDRIAQADGLLGIAAEIACARLDSGDDVVLDVLHRVDRVVANGPEHRGEIDQEGGRVEPAEHRAPADQPAP